MRPWEKPSREKGPKVPTCKECKKVLPSTADIGVGICNQCYPPHFACHLTRWGGLCSGGVSKRMPSEARLRLDQGLEDVEFEQVEAF